MRFFTATRDLGTCAAPLAALLGMLCFPASSTAQPGPREGDLRTLRAAFRQSLLNAILPEKRAYAAQLREAERKLAESRDYADAMQVRDERLALEQQLTAYEQELPALAARAAGRSALLPERIVFRPREATLAGLKLGKDGALDGWDAPRSSATWKLPALPAGGYEVTLHYACSGSESGSLEVRESFYYLRGQTNPTGDQPARRNLGTLRIRDGAGTITLVADRSTAAGRMRLFALELTPVNR